MPDQNYSLLLKQVEALLENESDLIANAANVSSLLFHNLENVNWVGFYFLKQLDGISELVLGPFSGQPACTRIAIGKGVCGTSFADQKTLIVEDVHAFEGHIACDVASESEIVVPFTAGSVRGVFDIDSPVVARFGESERDFFESVVRIFCNSLE